MVSKSNAYYEHVLEQNPSLAESLRDSLAWSPYIPHSPTGKQLAYLMLPHREALYGGAAGGGKSDALLMGALQHVGVPGYSAILFRQSLQDLQMEGNLIARSLEWLGNTDAKYDGSAYKWSFPTSGAPSHIQFGYMRGVSAPIRLRYQGAEFQYIGFDEVTQQHEDDYRYMFSRLRRKRCALHNAETRQPSRPNCPMCREAAPLQRVPLRMRAATNPGGPGHLWVRRRFGIKRVGDIYRGTNPLRPHVPAFIEDNPYLDPKEYRASLSELDPVTREQLLRGDWGVSATGRFRKRWMRYFSWNGDYIMLGPGRTGKSWHKQRCRIFQTIDPAASEHEGPGDETRYRKGPSWTVIATWMLTPDWNLLLINVTRFRKEIPDIMPVVKQEFKRYKPDFIGVETGGTNLGIFQLLSRSNLPIRPLTPRSGDKIVRSTTAAVRMEQGKIWLPEQDSLWKEEFEAEIFTWTGHPDETNDQIDVLSYAAMIVASEAPDTENLGGANETPSVW